MVDSRFVATAAGQAPTLPAHLTTKSYVDLSVALPLALPSDQAMYGDLLSSTNRRHAPDAAGMDNGFYTITGIMASKSFTASKIRFAVVSAGTVTGTPAVALSLYGGPGAAQPLLATAPVTGAMLTTAGVKELTLSTPVTANVGYRYTALFYIPPSAFSARASFASVANARSVLTNPAGGTFYNGYKAASAAPPASIDTSDGSWNGGTTVTTVLWWALTT